MFARVSECFHVIHYRVHNTQAHIHGYTQQEAIKMHTLCVQMKSKEDYGSLLLFTRAASPIVFPSVTLKAVVLSREVLKWFFH